jgi:hypothetical protein
MKILLDENFPLALVRRLREERLEVDHIILLGLRGTPDSAILDRLDSEDILFPDPGSGVLCSASLALLRDNIAGDSKSADKHPSRNLG